MNLPTSLHAAREMLRVKTSRNEFVILVHEATNEDPWGPTGPQMENVCRVFPRGSSDIMEEIRLRLKHREKSWRSCYKSLLLLDYLARNVSETSLPDICSVLPILRQISQSFYYTGKKGVDHGLSVRERAKKLTDLLSDGALLRGERDKAALTHSKLTAGSSRGGTAGGYSGRYSSYSSDFAGNGGGGGMHSSSYDPYIPRLSPVTRTREEQERFDMELAARMQREEESRSGLNAADIERRFHQQAHRASAVSRATVDADMELARRLQEEEEAQARLNSDGPPSAFTPATPKSEPRKSDLSRTETPKADPVMTEPPKPATDMLDDLFAPAPLTGPAVASTIGQPGWASAPAAQSSEVHGRGPADPFDAFLNTCMKEQQQFQMPPMEQGHSAFMGTAQSQPPASGGGMWFGGAQQTQPMMMPNHQQQQQQQFGGSSVGVPPPQFTLPPESNQWGMTAPSGNFNSSNVAMQQMHPPAQYQQQGGVYQSSGALTGFMGANTGGMGTGSGGDQQFTNNFAGYSQNNKSLDALMSERRTAH